MTTSLLRWVYMSERREAKKKESNNDRPYMEMSFHISIECKRECKRVRESEGEREGVGE